MIVPSTRLVWWTGLAAVPMAAGWTFVPGLVGWCALPLAGLALAAALDAWLGRRNGPGITVSLPAQVRLTAGREAEFVVELNSAGPHGRRVRLGIPWPRGMQVDPGEISVDLPGGGVRARVTCRCRAIHRGCHVLRAVFVESASPAGLWLVRTRVPVESEVRVYANLLEDRRQVAAVFLNRGTFGTHAQRMVGRGREFEKLRDYVPGDALEDIHWKATARRGRPATKTYQMERTQEVYVVLDQSRLSGRLAPSRAAAVPAVAGPGQEDGAEELAGATMLDRFMVAALVLGVAAGRQGDLFGLLTFSDQVHGFLRARNGRGHFEACRDALLRVEPRPVAPDFDEMFTFVRLRLRRRALLVVLTALDDPLLAESFGRSLNLVQRQHLVLVNLLRPAGVEPLFGTAPVAGVEDLYGALAGHLRWRGLRELQQQLQHRGVRLGLLENEHLAADLVRQYLDVKRGQRL